MSLKQNDIFYESQEEARQEALSELILAGKDACILMADLAFSANIDPKKSPTLIRLNKAVLKMEALS